MLNLEIPSYEDRKKLYDRYFGVGYLNATIDERLAVIGLICNVTHQLQMKKPDVTCYRVIMKILENFNMTDNMKIFIEGLSIMCEDVMLHATSFPDFGIKNGKERVSKIRDILETFIPF